MYTIPGKGFQVRFPGTTIYSKKHGKLYLEREKAISLWPDRAILVVTINSGAGKPYLEPLSGTV